MNRIVRGKAVQPSERAIATQRAWQGRPGMGWARRIVCTTLVLGALCGGCGAHFEAGVYRNGPLAFQVGAIPESWERIEVSGALLAFRDRAHQGTAALHGRCAVDGDDVPLTSLTQHLFLEFTERNVIRQQVLSMDGREALRTELTAKLDGVRKGFIVYVLKKDGCVYDFLYICPVEELAAGRALFEPFVAGFHTLPSRS